MVLATRDDEDTWTATEPEEDRAPDLGVRWPGGPANPWRITVAGASVLDVVPDNLLYFLTDGTPRDSTVLLRRGIKSRPGAFELMVAQWCKEMGHPNVKWVLPDPGLGTAQVFMRDGEMVKASDLVLAFFAPGRKMEGGTGHVVERAIDMSVPVYSFELGDDIVRVGEHDPLASWQRMIKDWFEGTE